MKKISLLFLVYFLEKVGGFYENQPKFISQDGHLIFESAADRNITFRMKGNGVLKINDLNILDIVNNAKIADGSYTKAFNIQRISVIDNKIFGRPNGILRRISRLENRTRTGIGGGPLSTRFLTTRVRNLGRRVTALEGQLSTMSLKLLEDNCRSNPCQNGGTCTDLYDNFLCKCPKNWEGLTCSQDVNECANFAGTDLGCQNGATCMNTPGSYSCICLGNWLGLHCTSLKADCLKSGSDLCGHGNCVQTNQGVGYNCICEQGWKTDGVNPGCSVDVNECTESKPHCSVNPVVECINFPGSFACGACPMGFKGNGFYCTDVDECETNNGGCSTTPLVSCLNTHGSYKCGSCPPGYQGDGRVCTASTSGGLCAGQNICHPAARCLDMMNTYRCICPTGYAGNGIGPIGCIPLLRTPCQPNPCMNGGTCNINGTSFSCDCPSGTYKPRCLRNILRDPCIPNPCANRGVCSKSSLSFKCECGPGFTGGTCRTPIRACGGLRNTPSGTIKYPPAELKYEHNSRCAWLIRTNSSQVLNITFTKFEIEYSRECRFDWLQIHDGRSSASHMIGRYCGSQSVLPNNGSFTSTHNVLYMWFRSDNSTNHDGFEMTWNSIKPICGGEIETSTYGLVKSPGSPGNYPPNRDCVWTITAPEGKRLILHFYTMKLEVHETCNYDYLAIHAGGSTDEPLLQKFCNTSHPEPLTTPSNVVTLSFHSDADNNDAGFQVHYTVVEGFPGCGGHFNARLGEFGTPVVQNSYPANSVCDYVIELQKKNRIRIEFTSFDLEESNGCRFDYVEIYEGKSDQGELVGRWCGTQFPPVYKSQSNILLIKFKSDWSNAGEGFRIKYETLCGGEFEEENGIITSPSYPENYDRDRTCEYSIAAPLGKAITLDFLEFDVERNSYPDCEYDRLEVYDGTDVNSTLLGKFCGESAPKVISSLNHLFLRFESDSSITSKGFKANYSFFDVGCGGIMRKDEGVIKPPTENDRYKPNTDCTWVIVAPPGFVIMLTWTNFDLETGYDCSYDYVEVFDNSTNHAGLIGKYCGSNTPPTAFTSGNKMTIRFVSDSDSNDNQGFAANYKFVDATKLCGGNYFTTSGMLRSPGWPGEYSPDRECVYIISVKTGRQIELNFTKFELEDHDDCSFDYVEVRNGGTVTSPLIGKYCGSKLPPILTSFSNQLYLTFKSDQSRNYAGFELEWDATATGCGGILTSHRGSLSSPNYPEAYGENAQCAWRITSNQGSTIQIVMADLDMENHPECNYDYLEIFDGRDSSGESFGRFCTQENVPLRIETVGNNAFIRMKSDISNQGRGFNLRYNTDCKRQLSGHTGVIESPNFPENYPVSIDCEWTINATKGNKLILEFSNFDLENFNSFHNNTYHICNFDYLEILEYKGDNRIESKKYCNSAPPIIKSSGDRVVVKFHTDISGSGEGFRLEWQVDGCGGILTRPRGEITSPNYPNEYPGETECEWTITAEYGSSVQITISEFDLESSGDCSFDGLIIANGANKTHEYAKLCHRISSPMVITSNGHQVYLKFYSDSSSHGRGFKATYTTIPSKCGGVLSANAGFIYSPNYPKVYNKNETCEWKIQTVPGHTLDLNIVDFDMQDSENCVKDSLQLYEGRVATDSQLKFNYCGSQLPNQTSFSSIKNELLLVLTTDGEEEAKGFKLSYAMGCGSRILANSTGSFHLPDILKFSHDNCTWIIETADPDQHITLTISHFNSHHHELHNMGNGSESFVPHDLTIREGDTITAPLKTTITGNKDHTTIISSGQVLFVNLYSWELNLARVEFEAHYSVFENACGGTLTSSTSRFSSPAYPKSYPLNVECIWNIKASPGNKLSLSLEWIDIFDTENCNDHYLEVRAGSSSGKLLGVFCGQTINQTIANSEFYWVKFRSGSEGSGRGFVAQYSYLVLSELSGESGKISSPMYPRNLLSNTNFDYRITVDYPSVISINFKYFKIDSMFSSCTSSLEIFDAYDNTGIILNEKTCGVALPKAIQTSSNVAFLRLYHSVNDVDCKFLLEWKKVAKNADSTEIKPDPICGNTTIVLKNESMINISSPSYPLAYPGSLNCTYDISMEDPGQHPMLYLIDVDLEDNDQCNADHLSISSGSNKDGWKSVDKICNLNVNNPRTYEGTPNIKLSFITDYSIAKTGFFSYVYPTCGGILEGPNGVIDYNPVKVTRALPQDYCMWNITVRTGQTIAFEFESFNVPENSQKSCESFLVIKNGRDDDSPVLGNGQYCGTTIPIIPPTSGNRAFVKFNGKLGGTFKLKYKEIGYECGSYMKLSKNYNSTEISSPNFPNIPPAHTECLWKFLAPNGERLQVDFIDRFDLTQSSDCQKEYVEIRDGGTTVAPIIGTFCNTKPSTQRTTSNALQVKFFTDVSDPKNGFKAKISIATCGGMFTSDQGFIRSPNYPGVGAYPTHSVCEYKIVSKVGSFLNISFTDIDLPEGEPNCSTSKDNIQIFSIIRGNDLPNESKNLIGTYCGSTIPPLVQTDSNEAQIVFKTFADTTHKGFSLKFISNRQKCGGFINGESGYITSPGYPSRMQSKQFCEWKITVPKGRRVKIDFEDLDLMPADHYYVQRLAIYNDHSYMSRLGFVKGGDSITTLSSTDNRMLISMWNRVTSNHRGFKLRYSSDEESLCKGDLNDDEGTITNPSNVGTYFCSYKRESPALSGTLVLDFKYLRTGIASAVSCKVTSTRLYVMWDKSDVGNKYIANLCGNLTSSELIVRSPFPDTTVQARQSISFGNMTYEFNFKTHRCGGMLSGDSSIIQPTFMENGQPYGKVDCAWYIAVPTGTAIDVNIPTFNLKETCDKEYIIIYNGPLPTSPVLQKLCKNDELTPLKTTTHQVFIVYHTDSYSTDTKFNIETTKSVKGCGGFIDKRTSIINSPVENGKYPNNIECSWEIQSDPGYHIGLVFTNRFFIEESSNCTKDFLEVYDYKNSSWVLMDRLCGRKTFQPFNSTATKMKLLFRSDGSIQADGFSARWYMNCGGTFDVTKQTQILTSPGYPIKYGKMLTCNYTFIAPKDKFINVDFLSFDLEKTNIRCSFDNVTVYKNAEYMVPPTFEVVGTYCRDAPPSMRYQNRIVILFKSDRYIETKGFALEYKLDSCGGVITEPTMIQSTNNTKHTNHMDCFWNITAPPNHSVVVHFESFAFEHSDYCYFDYVEIFKSLEIEENNKLIKICGNLTTPPSINTESNKAVIHLKTDMTNNGGGFVADIRFIRSCDKVIDLANTETYTLNMISAQYEAYMDCQIRIKAPLGYVISIKFDEVHIAPCVSNSSRKLCSCDYLQLRDGAGPLSELIDTKCGHETGQDVISSGPSFYMRFVTDSIIFSTGFKAVITRVLSPCGQPYINVTSSVELKSPGHTIPSGEINYLPNLNCKWILVAPEGNLNIEFIDLDIEEADSTGQCSSDKLEFTDEIVKHVISEDLGNTVIYKGHTSSAVKSSFYNGVRSPNVYHQYCGQGKPSNYFSSGNKLEVTFKSNALIERTGFKIIVHSANSCRNYTSTQGRVMTNSATECSFYITAPENYTLSLHFTMFIFYEQVCENAGLSVYENGPNGKLLRSVCGYETPQPIFGNTNKLFVKVKTVASSYGGMYDITYLATNKGSGCGGEIFNYGGLFSSPGYPSNHRNFSDCRWEVTVPQNLKVALKFKDFNMGLRKDCDTDYVQFVEIGGSGQETVARQFCGDDTPALYKSLTNRVIVKYMRTVNFAGLGWDLQFMGVTEASEVTDY